MRPAHTEPAAAAAGQDAPGSNRERSRPPALQLIPGPVASPPQPSRRWRGTGARGTRRLASVAWQRLVTAVAASVALIIISAVMLGWMTGSIVLRQINLSWASMKIITATSFGVLAVALLAQAYPGKWVRLGARALAGAVVLVAMANLAQYLPVAGRLLGDVFGRPGTGGAPMAPATATAALLLGVGLAIGAERAVAQGLFLAGAAIAYVALTGYVISVAGLYSFGPFGSVSLHTATVSLIVAVGALFATEGSCLRRIAASGDIGALLVRRLVPPSLMLFPSLGAAATIGERAGWWSPAFGPVITVLGGSFVSVTLVMWMGQSIGRLERLRREALRLADRDPLTGAGNRRSLEGSQARLFGSASSHEAALLAIDLDNFKAVNDLHGHEEGDRVLVGFANCLRRNTRAKDVLVRTGGDEFLLLIPEAGYAEATSVASKLLDALAMWKSEKPATRPTASIGVAVWDPTVSTLDEVTRRADKALYQAKNSGKQQFAVYQDTPALA